MLVTLLKYSELFVVAITHWLLWPIFACHFCSSYISSFLFQWIWKYKWVRIIGNLHCYYGSYQVQKSTPACFCLLLNYVSWVDTRLVAACFLIEIISWYTATGSNFYSYHICLVTLWLVIECTNWLVFVFIHF